MTDRNRFDAAYNGLPPWDIGRPQPALLELLDEFPAIAPVLDVGCGSGHLSLELARRGLTVLGVDLSAVAIERAREQAAALDEESRAHVVFQVADARHPAALRGPFATVVDSGFFHLFEGAERAAFVEELGKALQAGGRYYLLGFAIEAVRPGGPRQVREEALRALFAPARGWRILALHPERFLIRVGPGAVPALAVCVERVQ